MSDLNTAAFYKYESENLLVGKKILNLDYELYSDNHDEYKLPIDGWYWFESIEDARIFFEIPEPEINMLGDADGTA